MPMQTASSNPPILNILRQPDFTSMLADWAGEKIFNRGADYFGKKLVKDMVVTRDGKIMGTVTGTRNYVSCLYLDDNDDLDGACTCPYDGICKHIVALALAAREAVLENRALPACGELDFRPAKLKNIYPKSTPTPNMEKLKDALSKLPKDALLDLLIKACELDGDFLLLCASRADPDNVGIAAMLNNVRNAIAEAASAPDFDDEYSSGPDYEAIAKKLRAITAAGKPEMTIELAGEVFNTCSNAIEVYDHDGELTGEIGEVAATAVAALREIAWPDAQKLVWAINTILQDDFGYSELLESWMREISDISSWSEVAKYLDKLQPRHFGSWRQDTLTDLRKLALKKADRPGELLKVYEDEAKANNNYLKLVDYLLERDKKTDAEKWIRRGLKSPKSRYDARELRKRLIKIREGEGNLDAIVALQTEIFVDFPKVEEYRACAKAAKATSQWDALKPLLILYLTAGKLPWLEKTWPCENRGATKPPSGKFPLYLELTELALAEKRPLDALKWYDEQRKSKIGHGVSDARMAEAIRDVAPERAFAIWKKEAERLINETNTKGYFEAAGYLEKMLNQSAKMGDKDRWLPYLGALREQHKRKKNFIKILDAIEQGKKPGREIFY